MLLVPHLQLGCDFFVSVLQGAPVPFRSRIFFFLAVFPTLSCRCPLLFLFAFAVFSGGGARCNKRLFISVREYDAFVASRIPFCVVSRVLHRHHASCHVGQLLREKGVTYFRELRGELGAFEDRNGVIAEPDHIVYLVRASLVLVFLLVCC